MNYRPQRVSELIKSELGKIILREIEFPDGFLATITDVLVDGKLETARVFVSVLRALPGKTGERSSPGRAEGESFKKETEAVKKLNESAGELQHLLIRKINIKPMPRIRFKLDRGAEKFAKIEKYLL